LYVTAARALKNWLRYGKPIWLRHLSGHHRRQHAVDCGTQT